MKPKGNDLKKNIGAILSDLRIKNGYSQSELAKICNTSKSSISHYEALRKNLCKFKNCDKNVML